MLHDTSLRYRNVSLLLSFGYVVWKLSISHFISCGWFIAVVNVVIFTGFVALGSQACHASWRLLLAIMFLSGLRISVSLFNLYYQLFLSTRHHDDILLIAPSFSALQILLAACDEELTRLGMQINEKKSVCMRFGARFKARTACENLRLARGGSLQWSSQCRYLGVYFVSGRAFRCSFDQCKCQHYKTFNAVFS